MKELPDEKKLAELLGLAKEAEQRMREAGDAIEAFSQKWERRLKGRQVVKENVGGRE
ncbi:hypothetical protein ACE1CD_33955 [Aerosakkonema sp. BLCC-F183]|uniref:hypothetical protein n=1 Tax=Aerosakkonema sp. BLCC-F183 TaxID=3342834 RepID=UPI0035B7068D